MSNFTPRARQVLVLARKEAERFNHNYIGTEHLLLGILKLGHGVAVSVFERMGHQPDALRREIESQVGPGEDSATMPANIPYTPRVKKVLSLSQKEANNLSHSYVGTEHLLLGLLREGEGVASRVLQELNLDIKQVREEILREIDPNYGNEQGNDDDFTISDVFGDPGEDAAFAGGDEDGDNDGGKGDGGGKTPALDAFGTDLTKEAREGEIDPIIGRHQEIERVIQVLCRRTKNNPVLIGEAGVGKTAIAEGLAQEIVHGNVPELLSGKRVITLDLALMVAGTKYRGQFEERIKAVMDEVRKNKNVILFLDELHTLVGAGGAEGAMDASNIIKPALSRGRLQCIGATTLNEYRKQIEKDAALERRFQKVMVDEPSEEDTLKILQGLRQKYEAHHKVSYTPAALEQAVRLTARYITDRYLPDKAIDIIDEAGSRARIGTMTRPPDLDRLEAELEELNEKKVQAVNAEDFGKAAGYRDAERAKQKELDAFLANWKKDGREAVVTVGEEDIMTVVSKITGVPLTRMEEKEAAKLLRMEDDLKEKVVGQDEAVTAIAKALRRSRADLKDPRRPIGTFLFLGPTGVGKTYLARNLAEFMFGDPESLIQIDMSEYMEKFASSRLIGSPPGYVGYEEGGQLSEAVRRRPYSVVLFDEVEKAHPDVMNLLLQILEEGMITDSFGRKIDFRNTVIILTSNAGASSIRKQTSLGFGAMAEDEADFEGMRDKIMEEAKKSFRPEFLNRLDELVVFRMLEKEHLSVIVGLETAKLFKRLGRKGVTIELTDGARDFLIDKGYDPAYGARPMRRAVERHLEDPLAESLLRGEVSAGQAVTVHYDEGAEHLRFETKDIPGPAPEDEEAAVPG